MKIIQPKASPLSQVLPGQTFREGESYRFLHFVVSQAVEDGMMLYNILTRETALLSREEAALVAAGTPALVPGLVEDWFLVPASHDDRKLAIEVREVGKMLREPTEGYSSFTVFTTTDCNARCFYCYEMGRSRIRMTEDTAVEVAEWILAHRSDGKLRFRWFGGEPLWNKSAISIITRRLSEAGVEFRSSMVSNGYLFDDGVVDEAVSLWNLKKIQITLDGTEEVYNRSKAFIHHEGSPYKRVLANIGRLLDAGVKVSVRLNVGPHNAEDLMVLVDELGSLFGGRSGFTVYSHALFGMEPEHHALVSAARKELDSKLHGLGFASSGKIGKSLRLNCCMADDPSSVTILPDGHLGKCEHYSDSGWFSSIWEEDSDLAVLENYAELRPELEECTGCALYPECYRLVKCDDKDKCYAGDREERLEAIRRELVDIYVKSLMS